MFSGISNVRIFVDDWHAGVAFYRDVLKLPVAFINDQPPYAGFMAGSVTLMLEPDAEEEGERLAGRFTGVSLATENIESTYEQLRTAGVEFTHPPAKQPWGALLTHFKDPSGNIVTIVEYRRR